jgi:hypothetical protein
VLIFVISYQLSAKPAEDKRDSAARKPDSAAAGRLEYNVGCAFLSNRRR